MPVIYAPETEYAKETVKWEAQSTQMGPGKRPYVFRAYPMMLHKAGRPANGLGSHCIVETRTVESEAQETLASHDGFRRAPLEAIAHFEAQELEVAKLAAEINYDVKKKLSPRAAAEVEAAQAAHSGHMPMVPVTPRKPRGRPAKVKES